MVLCWAFNKIHLHLCLFSRLWFNINRPFSLWLNPDSCSDMVWSLNTSQYIIKHLLYTGISLFTLSFCTINLVYSIRPCTILKVLQIYTIYINTFSRLLPFGLGGSHERSLFYLLFDNQAHLIAVLWTYSISSDFRS